MSHDDAIESGARIIDGEEDGAAELCPPGPDRKEESPADAGAARKSDTIGTDQIVEVANENQF